MGPVLPRKAVHENMWSETRVVGDVRHRDGTQIGHKEKTWNVGRPLCAQHEGFRIQRRERLRALVAGTFRHRSLNGPRSITAHMSLRRRPTR